MVTQIFNLGRNPANRATSILILPGFFEGSYTSSAVGIVEVSITTQAPFPNFGKSFLMIKFSNIIASVVPIKLTYFRTSLTDTAQIIETFFPRLFGFGSWVLEPFRDRTYNLTIAKFTPNLSINIKSLKQTYRIFALTHIAGSELCQYLYLKAT